MLGCLNHNLVCFQRFFMQNWFSILCTRVFLSGSCQGFSVCKNFFLETGLMMAHDGMKAESIVYKMMFLYLKNSNWLQRCTQNRRLDSESDDTKHGCYSNRLLPPPPISSVPSSPATQTCFLSSAVDVVTLSRCCMKPPRDKQAAVLISLGKFQIIAHLVC